MKKYFLFCLIVAAFLRMQFPLAAQDASGRKAVCVAFYNIENLFDTIDSPDTDDREFLPDGTNKWDGRKYRSKLENIAKVIGMIGEEMIPGGPGIIGLAEVENRLVLEDLIQTPPLRGKGYGIVHFDSPDYRGVDVAMLYKYSAFRVQHAVAVPMYMPGRERFRTRDQLVVSGLIDGEMVHVIVNHWPSRRSGPEYRAAAASVTRRIVDSLDKAYKDAKIIVMGDLNDDPTDPSVANILGARGNKKELNPGDLFNPMLKLFRDGVGSLAYRDSWNLFDQIIVSQPFVDKSKRGLKLHQTRVFTRKFLLNQEGQYAGYPFRTFAGGAYTGGYSDHLPVYIILVKD